MSCMGQSDATHSSTMPTTAATLLRRVSTGWPAGTALGPTTRAAQTYRTVRAPTRSHTSGWIWKRQTPTDSGMAASTVRSGTGQPWKIRKVQRAAM
jgi:hypothetical protein